ncbi:MAG: hypothetical protein U9R42_04100 [Bacteroidota bacterium]|nr:hypothetical protein [Bacteroidota bacterium]
MSEEIFDKKAFDKTYESLGKDAIKDVIDSYFNVYDELFGNVEKSVKDGDFKKLKFFANKMKGSLFTLFGKKPANIAEELLKKGINNNSEGINELFDEFKKLVLQYNIELKEYVDEL